MATYKQGILGGFSGRIGNVIGTFWKGRNIMRIRAASYNNPKTPAQQETRMKFGLLTRFLNAQKEIVTLGFGGYDQKISGVNAGMKFNFQTAFIGSFPDIGLDLSTVKLSNGSLPGLEDAAAESVEPGELSLAWLNNTGERNAEAEDAVVISVVDELTLDMVNVGPIGARASSGINFDLPASWSGRTVTVMAFFIKEGITTVNTASQVSETANVTGVLIA